MPSEGIRQPVDCSILGPQRGHRITTQGRTVRIHLAGILDRDGVCRLEKEVAPRLQGQGMLVVLDAAGLQHIDYRCVPLLVAWQRRLRPFRHRVCLARWNTYLRAILAMEDWDGELESGSLGWAWRPDWEPTRHVRVP